MGVRSFILMAPLLGLGHAFSADVLYRVTDLGTLPGCAYSHATAINNDSNPLGGNYIAHAFPYANGRMTDLGTLGGSRCERSGLHSHTCTRAEHAGTVRSGAGSTARLLTSLTTIINF